MDNQGNRLGLSLYFQVISNARKIPILLRSMCFGYFNSAVPLMGPGSCCPLCAGVTRACYPFLNILLLRSEEFGGVFLF